MENINKICQKYGQNHILKYIEQLDTYQRETLKNQIERIDFKLLADLYKDINNNTTASKKLEPAISYSKMNLSQDEIQKYSDIGENEIKKGRYAIVTMAGGQGTRLGFNGPKGTYVLDTMIGQKSFFELIVIQLKEAYRKYDTKIHWYIMTSRENDQKTREFFEENEYFLYFKECIHFFIQGELPMLNMSGLVIMEDKANIHFAGDGNGSIFKSMLLSGVLNDMQNKNIEWVHIAGIDNILTKNIDAVYLGMTKHMGYSLASKSIIKEYPEQKVGVFCKINGKYGVVEYTELTEEQAHETKANGELAFSEANIVCSLFNIELLKKVSTICLPYHVAIKKCDILDESGNIVMADIPNAYKFESYIFDSFAYADNMLVLRVNKSEEFAPVKNKEGVDSVETATKLFNEYMKGKLDDSFREDNKRNI